MGMASKSGLFILEGVEGAGKSTQIRRVSQRLQEVLGDCEVLTTREPGGTPFAERIRQLVMEAESYEEKIHPETVMLLMFAARKQHIEETILPAVEKGQLVLSDRFLSSSYTMQVVGDGADEGLFYFLASTQTGHCVPDHTFILQLDPKESARRSMGTESRGGIDAYDNMSLEMRERICKVYDDFTLLPHHTGIDATLPEDEITELIVQKIKEILEERASGSEVPVTPLS